MSTPKGKTTKSKKGRRRSHKNGPLLQIHVDEQGNPSLAHHASPVSGTYRGRQVVDVEKRMKRRVKKLKPLT
tara:strand:+ start:337 stop:552 length:216 start_codon:yes stop_codon:yes gene_type:complete